MAFSFTADELLNHGLWDRYCKLTGLSVWSYNEGQVAEDEVFTLTDNEAIYLGLMEGELPEGWPPEDHRPPMKFDPDAFNALKAVADENGFINPTELHLNREDYGKVSENLKGFQTSIRGSKNDPEKIVITFKISNRSLYDRLKEWIENEPDLEVIWPKPLTQEDHPPKISSSKM